MTDTIDPTRVKTKDLAAILGVSPETIRLRERDGTFKTVGAGKYDLAVTVQAYIDYVKRNKASEAQASERMKVESERARKLKLENDIAERKMLPLDEVVAAFSGTLIVLRQHVSAISARVAALVAAESDETEIRQIIKKETDKALYACETGLQDLAGVGGRDSVGAAKETAEAE